MARLSATIRSRSDISDEEVLGRCREIASVFTTAERMLREDNLGTFGHMITHAYHLLQHDGELVRSRSRFILVDEFQDVNFAQVKVLERLGGEERNVFAVGDPDQAIYRFRGASSAAFVLFQRHFPGLSLVKLEKNRRSLSPILHSAFALISKNPDLFNAGPGSTVYQRSVLISAREEGAAREGKQFPRVPVEAVVLMAKDFECTELVAALRDWQRKTHRPWSDCAVLYRTHSHRDQLAAIRMGGGLARAGYPYVHPGDWLFITYELPRLSGIAEGQSRQHENRLADESLFFRRGTTGCDADRDDHHHGAIRNRNLTTIY